MSWQLIVTHKIENTGLKFRRRKNAMMPECWLFVGGTPTAMYSGRSKTSTIFELTCTFLLFTKLTLLAACYQSLSPHLPLSFTVLLSHIAHLCLCLSLQLSVLFCLPAFFVALALLLFQCLSRLKELLCRSTRSLGYRTAACGGTQIHTEFHCTHNSDWSTRSV